MIKLPALWRSGHDTNWDGSGGGGGTTPGSAWSGAGIGITRVAGNLSQACDPSCRGSSVVHPRLLHNSVPRPEILGGSGFFRAKLCELDEIEVLPPPLPPPPFFFHGSSTNSLVSSRNSHTSMGNKSSSTRVPVISYRSSGISEKQDGASVQSKKLEPLKLPITTMAEKSTQTFSTKNVALDTSSLVSTNFGKPATLRGGSSSPGPGPGWYSPKSQPSSPAFSMGSRLGDGKRSHSPGPGAHYVKRRPDGPGYTMSPRFRDAAKDRSPGPGQHNLPGTFGGPAYTMAPRFNSPPRAHSPKPFASSLSVLGKGAGPMRETNTSWTKTAVEGSLNAHANVPGHGVYSSYRPEHLPKKKKEKKKEVGYFIVKVNPKGPAYKITKTGTFLMPEPDDPAFNPERGESGRRDSGNLDRRGSRSRRRSSLSPRRPSGPPQPDPTPGPGEHQDAEFQTNGPWITIKSRIPLRPKENFPGPGTYDVVSRPSSPSFSLGTRRFVPEDKTENPGPGAYRIIGKPHGPHFSITGKPRDSSPRSRSPGPGAYKYENGTIGYGLPAFTITGKATSPRESDVPGPGTYSVRLPRGPAFTMQSRQSSPRTPNFPSPGSYSPQHRMREELSDTPGPGSYTSRSSMDGPSFSMHGRLSSPASSTSRSSSPGPGAYTISSRPTSPSFTMYGPVKKSNEWNDFPGSGAYCPKLGRVSPEFSIRGKLPVQQRSRRSSFSIRGKISREERPRFPGQGAYNVKSGRSSPSFSNPGKIYCEERPRSPRLLRKI
ncbi:DNA-directed RNA polymerase II subunit RPB1 [Selaginella moellendorffii]|uniref:DNA-directed RNA polymerase II subunit RPB1 n=1 Tax=Selaginella moellendorffii TaxID=88036 RepID=UPI000D1C2DA0|nr:DNA-directed RNA polymerase II subunit RPB1 [Selaginella moellendorffii]|eukprot:XP_024523731.1 DNA-directed RNA polymerase II subunit RPB1 [Selaginella moellendorffii]